MPEIGALTINLSIGAEPARRSLLSALEVLRASDALRDRIVPDFGDLFGAECNGSLTDLSVDAGNLLRAETVFRAADGALELVLNPSDRYLDLMAAIARDGDLSCDLDFHGWPILSVAVGPTTVSEAGGESIPAGGNP